MKILKMYLGINLISYSLLFIILNINVFILEHSILRFIVYIFTHVETLLFIPGVILIFKSFPKSKCLH